jgi:hypothetical protein
MQCNLDRMMATEAVKEAVKNLDRMMATEAVKAVKDMQCNLDRMMAIS